MSRLLSRCMSVCVFSKYFFKHFHLDSFYHYNISQISAPVHGLACFLCNGTCYEWDRYFFLDYSENDDCTATSLWNLLIIILSQVMQIQDVIGSRRPSCESLTDQQHLHPSTYGNTNRRSPSLR